MPASETVLGNLHDVVAQYLMERLASGEATASDVSNALKMLKDNDITCTPANGNAMGGLKDALNQQSKVAGAYPDELRQALDGIGRTNLRVV